MNRCYDSRGSGMMRILFDKVPAEKGNAFPRGLSDQSSVDPPCYVFQYVILGYHRTTVF